MMTCSTRRKNFCVDVFDVSELMQGSCSSRPPSVRFCAATITTLSAPSNLHHPDQQDESAMIKFATLRNRTSSHNATLLG